VKCGSDLRMSEMIERIARAMFTEIAAQDGRGPDGREMGNFFGYAEADYGKTILDGAYDLERIARAAIEAMREPTAEMVDHAWQAAEAEDAKWVWEDMIDNALKEPATTP
jgi:hypothetical protein